MDFIFDTCYNTINHVRDLCFVLIVGLADGGCSWFGQVSAIRSLLEVQGAPPYAAYPRGFKFCTPERMHQLYNPTECVA